ncbi:MAG: leucine-rich repeat domain-containing protein [Muribaculaceae bacterium]|nr:leucine-rich repeat domain-containing protein [Muribaculaceae bacterium]
MKRQFIIAIIALLTATVGHAADGDEVIVDGVIYTYSADAGAYIVTGWDGETPIQSLHIRGVVDDTDVEGIAIGAFEDIEDIIYLTIDEGIGYIGQNAFCRCYNLEVAILPEGLVTIEEEAFAFCYSLTIMVIPSTVEEIKSHVFSGCTGVTDVYFLMDTAEQLDNFNWWDGVYPSPGEDEHGGMEFNTNQNTIVHVPAGTFEIYDDSGKLEAWLFQEDNGRYPLWWIVNYGVVGRDYTVSDDLTAVYTDVEGGLYAKDDNHWLTPDKARTGEIDYMRTTGLMDHKENKYDQSNWVVLRNLYDSEIFNGHFIIGESITGKLIDKKNPEIEVTSSPIKGNQDSYSPNVYIPCSFMGRTQKGTIDHKTFAFVQPKPQEYIKVDWAIYYDCDEENEFYIPAPDDDEINQQGLYGGFKACYDLMEQPMPHMVDYGYYAFEAINRRTITAASLKDAQHSYEPNIDGGLSDYLTVYPISLPDDPIPTSINGINAASHGKNHWYSIDGRFLGDKIPIVPGLYINGKKKVIVK